MARVEAWGQGQGQGLGTDGQVRRGRRAWARQPTVIRGTEDTGRRGKGQEVEGAQGWDGDMVEGGGDGDGALTRVQAVGKDQGQGLRWTR